MKLLVRCFIPTFTLFSLFARVTKLDELHRHLPGAVTEISLPALMLYFSYMSPVIYAILVLTQLLILLPLYDKAGIKFKSLLIPAIVTGAILSFIISYIIWDGTAFLSLIRSVYTLFSLQMIYWSFNIIILFIIDKLLIYCVKPHTLNS